MKITVRHWSRSAKNILYILAFIWSVSTVGYYIAKEINFYRMDCYSFGNFELSNETYCYYRLSEYYNYIVLYK